MRGLERHEDSCFSCMMSHYSVQRAVAQNQPKPKRMRRRRRLYRAPRSIPALEDRGDIKLRSRIEREAAAPGYCTPEQRKVRWNYYGGKCWMCGGKATVMDHFKPLARAGLNLPSTLTPAP